MAMQSEVAAYAACQKDERGLDKAVEDAKYRMKRYGVTPNLLVIPPQERIQRIEPIGRTPPHATGQQSRILSRIASSGSLICDAMFSRAHCGNKFFGFQHRLTSPGLFGSK